MERVTFYVLFYSLRHLSQWKHNNCYYMNSSDGLLQADDSGIFHPPRTSRNRRFASVSFQVEICRQQQSNRLPLKPAIGVHPVEPKEVPRKRLRGDDGGEGWIHHQRHHHHHHRRRRQQQQQQEEEQEGSSGCGPHRHTSPPVEAEEDDCSELPENVEYSALLHGFAGSFSSVLFDNVTLSIVPNPPRDVTHARGDTCGIDAMKTTRGQDDTVSGVSVPRHDIRHTPGLFSWFPIFLPLRQPLRVRHGETVTINVWR